jgi:hypothetical protein
MDGQALIPSLWDEALTPDRELQERSGFEFFNQNSRSIEAFTVISIVESLDAVVVLLDTAAR